MSDNSSRPPGSASDPTNEAAENILRSILDNRLSASEISPTGELLNALDRYRRSRAAESANEAHSSLSPQIDAGVPSSELRPSASAIEELQLQQVHDTFAVLARTSRTTSTSNSTRHRVPPPHNSSILGPGGLGARRRILRSTNMANSSDALSSLVDLHHAGQQLETASQHMRALLDDSQSILTRANTTEEYGGDTETSRAAKRRRIDAGVSEAGFYRSYGYYGQVEPGKLEMEIESCDGGTYREEYGAGSGAYSASNVLKNDNSVYCTKGNRCNLVLRHQGVSPFCLTELWIKGPHKDFTDPIQEGMVFVSMNYDDLLTRTAQYQIQYSPPRNASRPPSRSIRHNEDGTVTVLDDDGRPLSGFHASDEHDYRLAQLPYDFTHQNAPPFNITTECFDSDSESSNPIRRRRRAERRAADRLSSRLRAELADIGITATAADDPSETESSDHEPSSDHEQTMQEDFLNSVLRRAQPPVVSSPAPRQRTDPRFNAPRISVGLADAITSAQEATQEAVKAVGGVPRIGSSASGAGNNLMAPLAWFFIERDKNKCIIKFDPPVSGRYILLKMWSPHHTVNGNIDIQSVVAKGFAGPRLFPAIQLR